MATRITGPDLEIPDESTFLRREWRVERVGWILILVAMFATVLGLLGLGPLSRTVASAGAVEVEYARITHHATRDELTIGFPAGTQPVTVEVRGDWATSAYIEGLSPEPAKQASTPGGVRYSVPATPGGVSELTVSFRMGEVGVFSGNVIVDGTAIPIRQFVLP